MSSSLMYVFKQISSMRSVSPLRRIFPNSSRNVVSLANMLAHDEHEVSDERCEGLGDGVCRDNSVEVDHATSFGRF